MHTITNFCINISSLKTQISSARTNRINISTLNYWYLFSYLSKYQAPACYAFKDTLRHCTYSNFCCSNSIFSILHSKMKAKSRLETSSCKVCLTANEIQYLANTESSKFSIKYYALFPQSVWRNLYWESLFLIYVRIPLK